MNIDYHVVVEHNYYSVPYQLVHQRVEVRLTATIVEVFLKGRRIASHRRRRGRGQYATDPAHMPHAHRAHAEWTPSRLIAWAETTGPATAALVTAILAARPHPEQGYRACLGLMRLGKRQAPRAWRPPAPAPCSSAAPSYRTVQNILASGVDRLPLADAARAPPVAAPPRQPPRPCLLHPRGDPAMLAHATVDKMTAMHLPAMAEAFQRQLGSPEFADAQLRGPGRPARSTTSGPPANSASSSGACSTANLRRQASLEDIDWQSPRRGLDKALVHSLATCAWIAQHRNLILIGPTGIGKSWLGEAFAERACRSGYSAYCVRALPALPRAARRPRRRLVHAGARPPGQDRPARRSTIGAWPRSRAAERHDLLEVLEDRTERASTLITSQVPVKAWHDADRGAHARRRDLRSPRPHRLRHRAAGPLAARPLGARAPRPRAAERGRAGRRPGTAAAQATPKTGLRASAPHAFAHVPQDTRSRMEEPGSCSSSLGGPTRDQRLVRRRR